MEEKTAMVGAYAQGYRVALIATLALILSGVISVALMQMVFGPQKLDGIQTVLFLIAGVMAVGLVVVGTLVERRFFRELGITRKQYASIRKIYKAEQKAAGAPWYAR